MEICNEKLPASCSHSAGASLPDVKQGEVIWKLMDADCSPVFFYTFVRAGDILLLTGGQEQVQWEDEEMNWTIFLALEGGKEERHVKRTAGETEHLAKE